MIVKAVRAGGTASCLGGIAVILVTGCAQHREPATLDGSGAVSVDVQSLWNGESATDPITAYKLRLASEPDNAALHNNLGNVYVLENHMDQAINEYKTAAQLNRRSPVPWNNLGTTYLKIGEVLQARRAFLKALDIDPRYALGYYNLGTLYDQEEDYDKAIEYYLKALSLKPELADSKYNPQFAGNRNAMVVKLRHYLEESGNISLPLDRLPE